MHAAQAHAVVPIWVDARLRCNHGDNCSRRGRVSGVLCESLFPFADGYGVFESG